MQQEEVTPSGPDGSAAGGRIPTRPCDGEVPNLSVLGAIPPNSSGNSGRAGPEVPESEEARARGLGPERESVESRSESSDADGRGGEGGWRIPVIVGFALLLLLALFGAVSVWHTRGEVSALRAELQTLRQESRRAEFLQARAALGRARAELDPLRETLPPDLVGDLEKAQEILDGMAERLRVPR